MPTIIYASPHQGILNLLRQQPHLHFLCLVEQRDHLKAACEQLQPDILLVSEQLPGELPIPLDQHLITLKQQHPNLRIVYLAGPSLLQQPHAKKRLQALHRHQLYHVHLQNELEAPTLLRYLTEDLTVEHLESQSGFDLSSTPLTALKTFSASLVKPFTSLTFTRPKRPIRSKAEQPSLAFDPQRKLKRRSSTPLLKQPSFKLPLFKKHPFTWKTPSFSPPNLTHHFKKYGPLAALLSVAIFCFYLSAKPVLEAKKGVNDSMSEWESIKEAQSEAFIPTEKPVLEDSEAAFQQQKEEQQHTSSSQSQSNASTSKPNTSSKPDETLLGLIKISEKGKYIGIRFGTSDAVLNRGAGLDELGVGLGEKGNTILYGHREEIFWDLKNIKIGQKIIVETLTKTLTYEVTNTRVTYPQDTSIYDSSSTHKLTLVTCHPFVYMGPTPERFVVEAELISTP